MENATDTKKQFLRSAPNLYRYVPTGVYYARPRIGGKLKVKCLQTDKITVARLRLSDFVKEERHKLESLRNAGSGKMTMGRAIEVFKERLEGNKNLKPRSKEYRLERLQALLKSWPNFDKLDMGKVRKHECLEWAMKFGKNASATAFNNTVGTLQMLFDIGIEFGARYENPAKPIGKHRVRPKELHLPTQQQFTDILKAIESVPYGSAKRCADLVRFLAYGGFRKSEAANVLWQDCDFTKETIRVRGDEQTGTKNWSARNVPMIPEMKDLLLSLRSKRPEAKPTDKVMLVSECQGALTRACKQVAVSRITHHDLRHLFATRCIESGVDIPSVAKWLGHKDGGALAMKVYGHLREEHSLSMAKKVRFGGQPLLQTLPVEPSSDESRGETVKEVIHVLTGNENPSELATAS